MNYLNIELATIARDPFIDADTAELGTWLRVMAYACVQENDGRLAGAAEWSNDKLLRTCGVSKRDVIRCKHLVKFEGADLVVNGYPTEAAKTLKVKRTAARNASLKRWQNGTVNASVDASDVGCDHGTSSESERKGKEKEGKEKELPQTPNGGLSEGEAKFMPLKIGLMATGKFGDGLTPVMLANAWRLVEGHERLDPADPGMIEFVASAAGAMPGKPLTPMHWIPAQISAWAKNQKTARRTVIDVGPVGPEM